MAEFDKLFDKVYENVNLLKAKVELLTEDNTLSAMETLYIMTGATLNFLDENINTVKVKNEKEIIVKSKVINIVADIIQTDCEIKEIHEKKNVSLTDMNINDLEQLQFYYRQIKKIFEMYSS